jgi:hypothetical protein
MTEPQRQVLLSTYFDLESRMQEYRKTLLWLTHGNHKDTPRPTVQETRDHLEALQDMITSSFKSIEGSGQFREQIYAKSSMLIFQRD